MIPVVAETVSEIHNILRPTAGGALVTNGSAEDLASKVRIILSQENLALQLHAEALQDFRA